MYRPIRYLHIPRDRYKQNNDARKNLDVAVAEHALHHLNAPRHEAVCSIAADDQQIGEAAYSNRLLQARFGVQHGDINAQHSARQLASDLRLYLTWKTNGVLPVGYHLSNVHNKSAAFHGQYRQSTVYE
jgi:hypothetical protein